MADGRTHASPDPPALAEFHEELRRRNLRILFWSACVFNVAYAGWTGFDYLLARAHWGEFFLLRAIAVGLNTAIVVAVHRPALRRYTWEAFWAWLWIFGAFIAVMLPRVGDGLFAYTTGFTLILYAAGLLPYWKPTWAISSALAITATVPLAFWSHSSDVPFQELIGAAFLVLTAAGLGVVMASFKYDLAKRDFFTQRELEAAVRRESEARDRVARASADLTAALGRLKETDRLKSEFFANVSHELRTPLTLVLAPIDTMLEGDSRPPEDLRRLRIVQRNALRMTSLVNDVLDLSKLTEVGLTVRNAPVDTGALVRRIGEDIGEAAGRAGIAITLRVPEEGPLYLLDGAHLEKILLNLTGNALKFTPRGGSLTLSATDGDDGLAIAVEDTGVGVPAEMQATIFERFRQVDGSTTRIRGGTGIGLALVSELARAMQGSVDLGSETGKGTRVVVKFPVSKRLDAIPTASPPGAAPEGMLPDARRAALAALLPTSHGPHGVVQVGDRGPQVLVVEDESELNGELVRLLRTECRVLSVADGEAAWKALSTYRPDVVISDIMMPKLDGLELAARMRQRLDLRETALILLTARGHIDDRIRGRELGVDTYLTKPFHPRELVAAVRGVLRSRMRMVGSFLLRERLGGGGQADVYRAEHGQSGIPAAIKILRDFTSYDEQARATLRREQRALSVLKHPNVPRLLDEGEQDGRAYIVMEYVRGNSVSQILQLRRWLEPPEVVEIAMGVAAALGALHEAGFVHRDVKCSNIMIATPRERLRDGVRLIDFGVAATGTATGADMSGTLPYMAPEVLDGGPSTPQSDIYALGVTMFCMATGEMPRGADPWTPRSPPSRCLRDARPDCTTDLDEIVQSAMDWDLAARFHDARSLHAALCRVNLGSKNWRGPLLVDDPTASFQREPLRGVRTG